MNKCAVIIFLLFFASCQKHQEEKVIGNILESMPDRYAKIISNPDKYKLQILYTRIDRNKKNSPFFKTFSYRANSGEYFYPASTIKLPVALMSLEKLNKLEVTGLDKYATMITDSAYSGQSSVLYDSSARNRIPSIAHYIKKIFLVSDNDAFNRIYEFLGQEYLNESLKSKGFINTEIIHRLSIFLSEDENRHTNPIKFYNEGRLLYDQKAVESKYKRRMNDPVLLGRGFVSGGKVIYQPMNFTNKNFCSLEDLHQLLTETLFPGSLTGEQLFKLKPEDYEFLYRYMSMYPGESDSPDYGSTYDHNYCKFFMYGDNPNSIPHNIRIFNKVGEAYGFLIDAAYIVDFEEKVEFILSAVIYVNKNKIFGDNQYEYDSLGYPFLAELGRKFYKYELNRHKNYLPDLKRFKFDY